MQVLFHSTTLRPVCRLVAGTACAERRSRSDYTTPCLPFGGKTLSERI